MALRTNTIANQTSQIGIEGTEGTIASAFLTVPDAEITPGWASDNSEMIRSSTYKFPSVLVDGWHWSTFTVRQSLNFSTNLPFLVAGFNYTKTGAGTPWTYTFEKKVTGADATKTLSIEWGVTGGVIFRALGCAVNSCTITNDASERTIEFEMIGREIAPVATFTAGATAIPSAPVPSDVTNYRTAATWAGLGAGTVLDHYYAFGMNVNGIYAKERPLKRAAGALGDRFETIPDATVEHSLLQEVSGADFIPAPFTMVNKKAGVPVFLEMDAVSGAHSFLIDMALLLGPDDPARADIDGLITMDWSSAVAADATSSKGLLMTVISPYSLTIPV